MICLEIFWWENRYISVYFYMICFAYGEIIPVDAWQCWRTCAAKLEQSVEASWNCGGSSTGSRTSRGLAFASTPATCLPPVSPLRNTGLQCPHRSWKIMEFLTQFTRPGKLCKLIPVVQKSWNIVLVTICNLQSPPLTGQGQGAPDQNFEILATAAT